MKKWPYMYIFSKNLPKNLFLTCVDHFHNILSYLWCLDYLNAIIYQTSNIKFCLLQTFSTLQSSHRSNLKFSADALIHSRYLCVLSFHSTKFQPSFYCIDYSTDFTLTPCMVSSSIIIQIQETVLNTESNQIFINRWHLMIVWQFSSRSVSPSISLLSRSTTASALMSLVFFAQA